MYIKQRLITFANMGDIIGGFLVDRQWQSRGNCSSLSEAAKKSFSVITVNPLFKK